MKKSLNSTSLMLLLSVGAAAPGAQASQESTLPNVVIFLADDAGWGDYSYSGNTQVETPRIDSLAEQGLSFDRFFVQPVCAPTRAELLTGRYHPRSGVLGVSEGAERMNPDEVTLADSFKAAGYATAAFGKWHNGTQWPYHPVARGFDEFLGHTAGHWGEYFDAPLENSKGEMERTEGYIVDVCTDRALDFIENNRDRAFFLFVPFTTPHLPWSVPESDWDRFRNKPIELKATLPAEENIDETRCALAMMENQDWNVGRILDKLRDLGLEENTIVLYFSDNGPNGNRWNGGMKGKKTDVDEGGVRSVFYLRWPAKVSPGGRLPGISGAIDLLPTLTSLAGIPRIGSLPLDGLDLSPHILKPCGKSGEDRMLFAHWAGRTSVRTQQYRMDDAGNLHDMLADPEQRHPVQKQQPEAARVLSGAIAQWRAEMFGPDAETRKSEQLPFTVGYPEFPVTLLPARDGEPHGEVRRSSRAPNCSYFVNWTRPEDRLAWNVEVATSGRYTVSVDYTCPEEDVGSRIELAFKESRLQGTVGPAWDPPLYTNQDTLPRPDQVSHMKTFRTLQLGEIFLEKGEGTLVLRALEIPGNSVMDLRHLQLVLRQ